MLIKAADDFLWEAISNRPISKETCLWMRLCASRKRLLPWPASLLPLAWYTHLYSPAVTEVLVVWTPLLYPHPLPIPSLADIREWSFKLEKHLQLWGNIVHQHPLQPGDVKWSPVQRFALWKWIEAYASMLHRRGAEGEIYIRVGVSEESIPSLWKKTFQEKGLGKCMLWKEEGHITDF